MGTENRGKVSDIIDHICVQENQYSFVQVIRLLRLFYCTNDESVFDRVQLRANLALTNSPGEICDIKKVSSDGGDPLFRLTLSILEMYGTGTPLPLFYTQELIHEQNRGMNASRDFIDIINSILYEAYFNIWQKHSILASLFESADEKFWERLYCLAGLGIEKIRKHFTNPAFFIAFSMFSSRPVRTIEGLRMVLSEISNTDLTIEQCVIRKAAIPVDQRCVLGKSSNQLGTSVYIGKHMLDRMNKIRFHIGPVDTDTLDRYFPDGETIQLYKQIISYYIDRFLIWDCRVGIKSDSLKTVQIGCRKSGLLGLNTWLFTGKLNDIIYTTIKPN